MVFQTLNKLKWAGKLDRCKVVIIHRGTENDRKVIDGSKITLVKRGYFNYIGLEETTIPNHRVVDIIFEGRSIWKKMAR